MVYMNLPRNGKEQLETLHNSNTLVLNSPAKLNLYLDVLKKRADGYHDLLTLFERITVFDEIHLTSLSSDAIVISSDNPDIPLDENNLAYKAAELIKRSQGVRDGVKIRINKSIPVGAGLGGGSSNAASVLLGLNKMFRLRLSTDTLIAYANRLGSDVAFFIFNQNFAIGTDRGGKLTSSAELKNVKLWHLLFIPRIKVITKDVYFLLDQEGNAQKKAENPQNTLKLTKKRDDVNILISNLKNGDFDSLNRNIYNRLSAIVMKSYSLVSELKSDLSKLGLENVHMSGSGPTLFVNFKTNLEAQDMFERIYNRISDRYKVFLAATL